MDDLLDYPLPPFVEYDVRPLMAVDDAFPKLIEAAERVTSAGESQQSTAPEPTTSPPRQTLVTRRDGKGSARRRQHLAGQLSPAADPR